MFGRQVGVAAQMGIRSMARRSTAGARPPVGLIKRFRAMLNSNPLATNCIVFGSLSGLAEFSQQTLLYKFFPCKQERKKYDLAAVGRYVIMGCVVFSPVLTFWYRWLDRVLPGKTAMVVMKKVVIDVVVLDIPYYAAFYTIMSAMEGKSVATAWSELKAKLMTTVLYSILLWVPAQTINFKFLPPRARVVFIALVTFLELNVLAIMKRAPHEPCTGDDGKSVKNKESEVETRTSIHLPKSPPSKPQSTTHNPKDICM